MTAEDKLQTMCISEFRRVYPEYSKLLFSVPNGADLSDSQRMLFTQTGMVPGVSDLILLVSRHGYGSLCLEGKVRKGDIYSIGNKNIMVKKDGVQSKSQHEWELAAISAGNKYVLFWNVKDFMREVDSYLK